MKVNAENILSQIKQFQFEILLGIFTFLLICLIRNLVKNAKRNFPPGPTGLPIVGFLPFLSENLHLDFVKLGKMYGDIFSIRLGSQEVVILHGSEFIREAFNKPELLSRPPNNALVFARPKSAFLGNDLHLWKEQRRFIVQSMKDLGLGKTKIEEDIVDEIKHFLEILRSSNGQPMDVKVPLSPSTSNNISALVFGKRFEYDDPDRKSLDEHLDRAHDTITQNSLQTFFPWIKYLPFHRRFLQVSSTANAYDKIRAFVRKELDKHKKSLDNKNPRDFIDKYLIEMKSKQEKDSNATFNNQMLENNVLDLFSAGSETVRTVTLWFIYTMAAYPEVQKKIQKEISEVLGSERSPEYSDIWKMPYTHAVIIELMRWKTIVPLPVTRYAAVDTKVGRYDIPKGTILIANFWNVHHDPRYWSEPNIFKPERFLSKDGKSVVKSTNLMTFSLGKRSCLGENMANMELFLYFTSILQKFDILFPEGMKPTFEAKLAVTYRLEPFLIRFIPRN